MSGDHRERHCASCNLTVYNISDMTTADAEAFLQSRVGRTCVRFYRRADGTILTRDCPVGLAALRRRVASLAVRISAVAFTALSFLYKPSASTADTANNPPKAHENVPLMGKVAVSSYAMGAIASPPPDSQVEMGEMPVRVGQNGRQ
jgi:hypothetical protein